MATQQQSAMSGNTQHTPHSIHLLPGEEIVLAIRHSRILLYSGLLVPALLLMLALIVFFYWLNVELIMLSAGVAVLALLIWMLWIYIDYRSDICILTNHRIIDIKRRYLWIQERRTETEYDNIREVRVTIANLFERIFRIGTVNVETLSALPDICLSYIDHPFAIQDEIYALREPFERQQYHTRTYR